MRKVPASSFARADEIIHHCDTDFHLEIEGFADEINSMASAIHGANVAAGWWNDLHTGERKDRNVFELLALAHSEISEALEGHRKGLQDDKLTDRPMIEVEIADTIIRLLDLSQGLKDTDGQPLDVGGAIVEKLLYNRKREDHKPEARKLIGGKTN